MSLSEPDDLPEPDLYPVWVSSSPGPAPSSDRDGTTTTVRLSIDEIEYVLEGLDRAHSYRERLRTVSELNPVHRLEIEAIETVIRRVLDAKQNLYRTRP